jgi:hypothetical protein
VAMEDESWDVSSAAVATLTDQTALEKIAAEAKMATVRQAAKEALAKLK